MDIINRNETKAFVTKDGSGIREILAPRNSMIRRQSLAEATVAPRQITEEHYHIQTEEIYYILQGQGTIIMDGERRDVQALDGIAIPPGARHQIENTGDKPLIFLCCCSPAYEHADTVIVSTPVRR